MNPHWDTSGIPEFLRYRYPGWRLLHSLTPRYLLSSLPGWECIPVGRIGITVCGLHSCLPLQVPDAGYQHVPMPEVGRLPMPEAS